MLKYKKLEEIKSFKVLVIGDIMLDTYQFGNCSRISPEAPIPIIDLVEEKFMLGGAGNVLKNVRSFGAGCNILTVIGPDRVGKEVINQLRELNIDTGTVFIDKSRKTTEKKRVLSSGQQIVRLDTEDRHPISKKIENAFINYVKKNIGDFKIIILSDYQKGILTYSLCRTIIEIANQNGIKTIIDPKGVEFKKYSGAYLIKPNLKEAEILLNKKIDLENSLEDSCNLLKKNISCSCVVITLAEKGMALLENKFTIIPTKVSQIFDVSGAGDTVIASLAICLACEFSLYDSCYFANRAASIVIKKIGSATTTVNDVINYN